MCTLFIILALVYFNIPIHSHDIEVMNSGIMTLSKDDMVLVLFITIHHHGGKARNIMATMVDCCEKINDEDTDCDIIQVFGEHLGFVQPGSILNVTFLYPNIYAFNRKAFCTIDIWNRGESGGDEANRIRHRVDFDTTLRSSPDKIPPHLKGMYNPNRIPKCETTDLDPFDGCNPVDCQIKYSGLRNFYNRKRKRCQKVPECIGDPNKELPDIVYVPTSNTCRNLEEPASSEDILDLINKNYETNSKDLDGKSMNIQCHHGEVDVRTGLCVCDPGWTSEPFDLDEYNQGAQIYLMCAKKCHPDEPSPITTVTLVFGILVALAIFLLVAACEISDYFCELIKRINEEEVEVEDFE